MKNKWNKQKTTGVDMVAKKRKNKYLLGAASVFDLFGFWISPELSQEIEASAEEGLRKDSLSLAGDFRTINHKFFADYGRVKSRKMKHD